MEKNFEIINKVINSVRKGIGVYYAFKTPPYIYGMVNYAIYNEDTNKLRDDLLQELPTGIFDLPDLNPNRDDILNVFEDAPEYDDHNEFVGVKSDKGTSQIMIPYCELTEQDMAEMILEEMPHLKYTHSGFIRCDSDEAEQIRKRFGCDIIEVVHKSGSDKYTCGRTMDTGHIDAKEYYTDDGYTVYDTMQELISELEEQKQAMIEEEDDNGLEFINNKLMCAKCVGEIEEGNIIVCYEDYDFEVYPRYVDGYVDKNSYIHEVAIKLRCVW